MSMTRVSRPGRRSPVASRDVLVVADGNEESYGAIGWARHVASASGAKVAVVDAAEGDDRESDTQVPRPHDRLSRRLDERGLGVDRVIVESGPVAEVVGRHAHDAGLVVIGSRVNDGRRTCHHLALVTALARTVDRPIAMVPHGEWYTEGMPIMVGIDGSDANRAVLRWAQWFAEQVDRPLIAVHVGDPLFRTFDTVDRLSTEDLAVRHEIEHSGAEFVERVDIEPGRSLAEYASIRHAGLLVVGASVRHTLGGRLIGGVASDVIELARCPVVVVPRAYQLDRR